MRVLLLLITFVLLPIKSFSQYPLIDEMINEEIKIRQKEGTNNFLKKYLHNLKDNPDILYTILFRPSNCIRCEARIPYFTEVIKQLYPDAKTLLITAYEDKEVAKHYLSTNNYKADYFIFDTNEEYKEIFSFNTNGLYTAYILKIDMHDGSLITGGDALTLNKQFIHEIYSIQNKLPYHTFENENDFAYTDAGYPDTHDALRYRKFFLNSDKKYPISSVYNFPTLNNNIFFYSDELSNSGYYFEFNDKKNEFDFKGAVFADSIEKTMYVDIPKKEYEIRSKNGIFSYIAMDIKQIADNKIGISYSLPRLFMESPDNVAYYNKEVILIRETRNLKKQLPIPLDFDIFNEEFMYTHFSFFPIGNDKVAIGCKKSTWPIEYDPEDYKGVIGMDPFMEEFYDTRCPYFAYFDNNTGKLIQRFGQLDNSLRASRTGYYYLNPIANCYKSKIIYGNGYTGKLYIADKEKPDQIEKEINVFSIDINKLPKPDPNFFYTLEYVKPYNPHFNRCIEQIILKENKVHCLVRRGMPHVKNKKDIYEYICIDIEKDNETNKYLLKKDVQDNEERILSFGLGIFENDIVPYYFAKNEGMNYIKFINLPR